MFGVGLEVFIYQSLKPNQSEASDSEDLVLEFEECGVSHHYPYSQVLSVTSGNIC